MPDPIQGPSEKPSKPEGPGKGPQEPQIGEGQENQSAFQMPQGPAKSAGVPSPMEVASQQQVQPISPQEMQERIQKVQQTLDQAKEKLNNHSISDKLTQEHFNALSQVSNRMNGDLKTIAENSGSRYQVDGENSSKNTVASLLDWINGSQKTLTGALNYLSATKKPNVASYMKMQYAVQRATQRAELFASVVSSSVSGIKTLMSTQLG